MNLPNCTAFSHPIFSKAFLCTQNLSKGTGSLQSSSLHSCNYGNAAVNMQNNHSGPSAGTCTWGELCLKCFKRENPGSCYCLQLWAVLCLFCTWWNRNITSRANRSTSSWDANTLSYKNTKDHYEAKILTVNKTWIPLLGFIKAKNMGGPLIKMVLRFLFCTTPSCLEKTDCSDVKRKSLTDMWLQALDYLLPAKRGLDLPLLFH